MRKHQPPFLRFASNSTADPFQEFLGERHILFLGEVGNDRPVLESHAVTPPFVYALTHTLSVDSFIEPTGKPISDSGAAAQLGDEFGMICHDPPIIRNSFGFVKGDYSDDPKKVRAHNFGMGTSDTRNRENVEIGKRLKLTRTLLGYPVRRDFARVFAGRDEDLVKTWEDRIDQWERGKAAVPLSFTKLLKGRFSITYDWIYDGDPQRLPVEFLEKLSRQAV